MNRKVIEVGASDINGSLRTVIESLNPLSYLGVDVVKGKGVDDICDIKDLVKKYGKESFELVICTEVMEHVRDWRDAVSNLKNILKPKGTLILTTRSIGKHYHGYPFDFWRYEIDDMKMLFSDLLIKFIEKDPLTPGVFVKAQKPDAFLENNLETHELYSILREERCRNIRQFDMFFFKIKWSIRKLISRILPSKIKKIFRPELSD
jgi:SAM-dependent methyltransferase